MRKRTKQLDKIREKQTNMIHIKLITGYDTD